MTCMCAREVLAGERLDMHVCQGGSSRGEALQTCVCQGGYSRGEALQTCARVVLAGERHYKHVLGWF